MRAEALQMTTDSQVEQVSRLYRAGYWALLLLAFSLPFEVTQRPLIHTRFITVTNLKVVFYVVVALAVASLAAPFIAFVRDIEARSYDTSNYFYRKRVALALFLSLLAAYAVSSLLSHHPGVGLKWTLDILLGGLLWLAVPLWLSNQTESKIDRLGLALVAGAVIAALVGFFELSLGARFTDSLLWFKAKPTVAGPYLRLSGTFQYANIAALYFELALPFALVGLVRSSGAYQAGTPQGSPGRRHRPAGIRLRWVVIVAWMLAVDVLLGAILLTYSRGALLGLFAGIIAMALATRRVWWQTMVSHQRWFSLAIAANLALVIVSVVLSSNALLMMRLTSQSDQDWYKAAYSSTLPATVTSGQRMVVPVTVENRGPLTWNARGAHPFQVSYHWLFPSKRVEKFEGIRTRLPSDVEPGGKLTVPAKVRAPCKSGHYLLVWDMVQRDVTWFSLKSATYQAVPVRVRAAQDGRGVAASSCTATSNRGEPTRLPTTLAEPPRQQLWSAAVSMLKARPLFGVGPDGFRLSYGNFSKPRQRTWDTRILANSLILELLADVGIVGAALFLVFLAVVAWSSIAGVWFGHVTAWWELALVGALAAFLGHGLVDYILGANAIFILFWLLCGLAATMAWRRASVWKVEHVSRD